MNKYPHDCGDLYDDDQAQKPRVRFCWHCGRKLRGNHFVEAEREGHLRILHKECAKYPERILTDGDTNE